MTTKITTVSKLEFPSKRDMNEIGPRKSRAVWGRTTGPVHWLEPAKESALDVLARVLFIAILAGLALWAALTAYPAEAKTIELRDCRTNEECCELYLAGNHGHVVEDAITKSCAGV